MEAGQEEALVSDLQKSSSEGGILFGSSYFLLLRPRVIFQYQDILKGVRSSKAPPIYNFPKKPQTFSFFVETKVILWCTANPITQAWAK